MLESLDAPGLWLLGGEDRSIPTPATVAILDQLIASGRSYAHVVFPGFGHNLSGAPIWPEIDRWLAGLPFEAVVVHDDVHVESTRGALQSSIRGRLNTVELRVLTAARRERLVRPSLSDTCPVQHDDEVGHPHR